MSPQRGEPIAIIGTGCRFPGGANSPSKLWQLLREPRDLASKIPTDRFNVDSFYHPDPTHFGTSSTTESYFLSEETRQFDPQFFNIQPAEAEAIDPQQRFLMETVYEAIESAGLKMEALRGTKTAVYVGLMYADYLDILTRDPNFIPTYTATGAARSIISNRISYFFDWRGPCMTIDTACSSSLVAIHQAVQTLRSHDSGLAIAAGANLIYSPEPYITESNLRMLTPTGRSRMWDADADGYARGEAIAAIVLKRLSDAIRDGDDIECVIRETGVNQDGRTKGITMPSEISQAALICDTYARAGLDPSNKNDRCQYFEAHGTGTPAGDPKEAEAVSTAFFNKGSHSPNDKLYIGSIKTIVGHTEGTAGLAGVIKASLAIQHGVIPPNLHFNQLAPNVKPFYDHLKIPTEPTPWPELPVGQVRRASVNSFGFGGTNSHAILESYVPSESTKITENKTSVFSPFIFSANSERALNTTVRAFSQHLKVTKDLNLRDLAETLSRRSALPFRTSFSALSAEGLTSRMEAKLLQVAEKDAAPLAIKASKTTPKILGIFTGQGAQWAAMGRELILSSKLYQDTIAALELSLAQLPEGDRPTWSLKEEILKDASSSRISEAALSQPLCTSIQIALVDLLKTAQIQFEAVVGHSSGEIAAAYTAGFINAHDAIRIAYYRGLYAKLACGPNGARGAMMAVGTSFVDAAEICEMPEFEGRVSIAASNSPSSITLSGDADAIDEVKKIFEEEKKFSRLLRIDTAYHSHHMLLCSEAYVKALQACKIKIFDPPVGACTWFSSVYQGKKMVAAEELRDIYWRDNMVSTVLFAEAVQAAVQGSGPYGIVVEVGPHPALKGPALQILQESSESSIPYSGALIRGKNAIESFSEMLGFVWTHSGLSATTFKEYERSCLGSTVAPKLLKDLPTYPWDHDRTYWAESRISMLHRTHGSPFHQLLGARAPDTIDAEMRWVNVLSPKEIPWVEGHVIQSQRVFPAAGYAAMALEAAVLMANERQHSVELVEMEDLKILRGWTFDDDVAGVETIIVLSNIATQQGPSPVITAKFACYTCVNKQSGKTALMSTGNVRVLLGTAGPDSLPQRRLEDSTLKPLDSELFYTALADLGYVYTGPFKAMSDIRRKMDKAVGLAVNPEFENATPLLIHPALFDVVFQAAFAAYCAPGDGRLWSLRLPTAIQRITINPSLCGTAMGEKVLFDVELIGDEANVIVGDVDVFSQDGRQPILKVEGIRAVPFSAATSADDLHLFSDPVWAGDGPDGALATAGERASKEELELAMICERVSYYYLRTLHETISVQERQKLQIARHHQCLFDNIDNIMSQNAKGKHPYAKPDWNNDSKEFIYGLLAKYPNHPEFKMMRAVGENIAAAIRQETTILEHMTKDGLLDEVYANGLGFVTANRWMSRMVAQVAHRYPNMKILEIGGGTGGSTKTILPRLGHAFSSYTFTDISAGFLERAQEVFKGYASRMIFKTLDIENDPTAQGFQNHSYDLIIAGNVLHATKKLSETMAHVRQLLKPGGQLLLLEVTNNGPMRPGFIYGSLPGWWVGADDNRRFAPTISLTQWNTLLKKTGFSGVDTSTPQIDTLPYPLSVIASQAIDENVSLIRRPLASNAPETAIGNLLLIGGSSLEVSKLVEESTMLLGRNCGHITTVETIEELHVTDISPMTTVLSLVDLDVPIFETMTEERWEGLKRLFELSRNVLWVTRGTLAASPYSNMSVGLGRSIVYEIPHLRMQFLNIEDGDQPTAQLLAEILLRLQITDAWEKRETKPDILWTTEPEYVLEGGKLKVLRMIPSKVRNNRYNSSRRLITNEITPASSFISIQKENEVRFLREEKSSIPLAIFDALGRPLYHCVEVQYSLVSPIKIVPAPGFTNTLFLTLGKSKTFEDRSLVLALSECNSSSVNVPEGRIISCSPPAGQEAKFLHAIGDDLIAQAIVANLSSGNTLIINDPEPSLATALLLRAAAKNIKVVLTSSAEIAKSSPWISIHPRISFQTLKTLLPRHYTRFLDFATTPIGVQVGDRIRKCLPSFAVVEDLATYFNGETIKFEFSSPSLLGLLKASVVYATGAIRNSIASDNVPTVALKDVVDTPDVQPNTVVDWTSPSPVSVKVETVDAKNLFVPTKTYLLVGLTRDLGTSLCQWMVNHGAKYIVITSRKPVIDATWLANMEAQGAVITVLPMDVTNRDSVLGVYNEVTRTLPPIGGVANAAMLLRDTPFYSMDLETFETVTRPKVEGSIYLDEIFCEDNLEFFILFSSAACVLGNSGQCNYTAANMFMTCLAAQRKRRGLAGSAINISAILGVGFVSRADQKVASHLEKIGFVPMSESDFHQMFAEAIISGKAGVPDCPELTSGIRILSSSDDPRPWSNNPKFSHCVRETEGSIAKNNGRKNAVSIKSQLLTVTNKQEAINVIQESFATKIQVNLQLSADDEVNVTVPLMELGVDSLVAVDVRSWFMKELGVDMPVLKVLGGASINDLINDALGKLQPELVPNMGEGEPSEPAPQTPPQTPHPPSAAPKTRTTSSTASEDGAAITKSVSSIEKTGASTPTQTSTPSEKEGYIIIPNPQNTILRSAKMSFGQIGFWFLRSYLEDQTTFNITCLIRVKGNLRIADFADAVQAIGQRHEALRTSFTVDDESQPIQNVLAKSLLHLEHENISNDSEVLTKYAEIRDHVYDLENGETMRVCLLSQSATLNSIIIGYHHINMDGVSLQIFLHDLEKLYKKQFLSPRLLQYPDFAARQRIAVNGNMESELAYWRKEFISFPTVLPLIAFSKLSSRRAQHRYEYESFEFVITSTLSTEIAATCRKHKTTPFHFYLAAFKTLLFRFLDVTDLCIGMADANRSDSDAMSCIGIFLNLLPLRLQAEATQTFSDALKQARTKATMALANSRLPFNVILEELNVPRAATHSPLFQAFIDYRQGVQEKQTFANCEIEADEFEAGRSAYDVSLDILENPGASARIILNAQKGLYTKDDAHFLSKSYQRLLEAFAKHPELHLDEPSLYNDADVAAAIQSGQGPVQKRQWPETIVHRIDDIVKAHGSTTAIKDGTHSLTYSQTSTRSKAIALGLQNNGIGIGSRVAVFQEPTSDWICSMLAIMRSGAIYVPLDLRNPLTRLANVIQTCKPSAILVHAETIKDIPALGYPDAKVIDVDAIPQTAASEVPNLARSELAALILFTSGSTGVPKGIIQSHHSLRNNIEVSTRLWNFGAERLLQQSPFTFDISLDQLFMGLANGGTVFIAPKSSRGDPTELTKLMADEKITYTKATPSEYALWLRYGAANLARCSAWKTACGGGETFTHTLKRAFRSLNLPQLHIFNSFGPTEVMISGAKLDIPYQVDDGAVDGSSDLIPVGFPLPNYAMYIVDKQLRPVPAGIPGEILIGGASLANSYLDNEVLTSEHFIKTDFIHPEHLAQGWTKVYRTGDRGRLRADGAVYVLGRMEGDSQIKLRGNRIELGDIESTIVRSSNGVLTEAIASVRGDPQYLVAFVVFSADYPPEERQKFLGRLLSSLPLPQYMVPALLVPLDAMPLNPHFKTDRRAVNALPLPSSTTDSETVSQLSEFELQLKDVWESLIPDGLGKAVGIGPDSDFFQVGGNSLLIIRLQALLRESFNIALPLVALFEASKLGAMAAKIKSTPVLSKIDWHSETSVSKARLPDGCVLRITPKPTNAGKVILLTGATGHLGRHLLPLLVADKNISKIHCVATRHKSETIQRQLSVTSDKIVIHDGDLSDPLLGLSKETFGALAGEVDVIIHLGANRSFWETYYFLRRANVGSTKALVDLALTRRIPIHFFSSGAVLKSPSPSPLSSGTTKVHLDIDTTGQNPVATYVPKDDGSDGYVASKWASESYLRNAATQLGIPVTIYRTLPTPTASENTPVPEELLHDLLRLSNTTKLLPVTKNWGGSFDLVSVHTVADTVYSSSVSGSGLGEGEGLGEFFDQAGVRYRHFEAGVRLRIKEVTDFIYEHRGEGSEEAFERVEGATWIGRVKEVGWGWMIASQDVSLDGRMGSRR